MLKKPIPKLLIFLAGGFLILGNVSFALAEPISEEGLKLDFSRVDENVNPGDKLEKTIKVTNMSGKSQIIYAKVRDFAAPEDESGEPQFLASGETAPEISLKSWITVPPGGVEFKPGEMKDVNVAINVPENASPGSHYGAVFFGVTPPEATGKTAILIGREAGALVLLRVSGEIRESADIREFRSEKYFNGAPPVKLITRIQNSGNVHVTPAGVISIKNMLGREVASLVFNEQGDSALPDSIRRFENIWNPSFALGRYEADLILAYGEKGQSRESLLSTTSFFVMPGKIILIVLGFFVILVISIAAALLVWKRRLLKGVNPILVKIRAHGIVKEMRYLRLALIFILLLLAIFVLILMI